MLDEKDRKMKTSLFSLTDFKRNHTVFFFKCLRRNYFNIDKQKKRRRRNSLIVIMPILLICTPPPPDATFLYGEWTWANR